MDASPSAAGKSDMGSDKPETDTPAGRTKPWEARREGTQAKFDWCRAVSADEKLSPAAKHLACIMAIDKTSSNGSCKAMQKELARICGCSKSTIIRAIKELHAECYLAIDKLTGANRYTIITQKDRQQKWYEAEQEWEQNYRKWLNAERNWEFDTTREWLDAERRFLWAQRPIAEPDKMDERPTEGATDLTPGASDLTPGGSDLTPGGSDLTPGVVTADALTSANDDYHNSFQVCQDLSSLDQDLSSASPALRAREDARCAPGSLTAPGKCHLCNDDGIALRLEADGSVEEPAWVINLLEYDYVAKETIETPLKCLHSLKKNREAIFRFIEDSPDNDAGPNWTGYGEDIDGPDIFFDE
jgi:hypothetical protein